MTLPHFARVPGVRVEPLGEGWVAYSPLAGSTHVLNDSGAAVLELLDEQGVSSSDQVAAHIAVEVGLPPAEIGASIQPLWVELIAAGLVREIRASAQS